MIDFKKKFKEWKKEAGDIPRETCPMIDDAIQIAKGYDSESGKDVAWVLDDVREANSQLRELGNFWYEKCEELAEYIEDREGADRRIIFGLVASMVVLVVYFLGCG